MLLAYGQQVKRKKEEEEEGKQSAQNHNNFFFLQGEVERVREIWDEVSERQRNQTMVRAAYFDAIHTKRSSENFTDLKPKVRRNVREVLRAR